MATNSSVFSGSTNAKYQVLHLVFNQVSQDIVNNRTNFSYEAYIQGTGGGSGSTTAGSYSITGATTKSDSKKSWSWNTTTKQTIATGSFYVNHNSDGTLATQTLSISASFKTTSATLTASTSVSLSVATIPRYASITGFSASINDRSASLSWTADKTISYWRWSTNSGSSYSEWIYVNATSGSTSISVSPGSSYGFRIQVRSSASGLDTTSSTVSKTATKTPSTLTLNTTSQNVGSGITWTINKSYSDYTHTIAYYFGNTSGWILGSAASNTASGAWTVPMALANQIPNATSGSGTIYVYTYYGGVHVGTNSYNFTAKVPDNTTWQPTVPSVTISDAGTRPAGITSYVQGKAKAKVVSSSTAQGGASISSYRVIVSDIGTYYGSTVTSGFLTKPGTVTITVRATDSRGYYREKVSTITVVEYSPPQLPTFNASRSQSTPTDILANFSASISPINSQNYKYFRIRSKASDGSWVTETDTTQSYTFSGTQIIVSNPDKSYTIEFYVQDSYTSITQTVQVGTAFTLLDFNASGRGMAIGKVSESDSFEVAIPTVFQNNTRYQDSNLIEGGVRKPGVVIAGLSSPGWYRVARFEAINNDRFFVWGGTIEMEMTRNYAYNDNEAHKVTLIGSYHRVNFFNQKTVGNQLIGGIRWQYDTNNCYLDIYYNGTLSNQVRFAITSVNVPELSFTNYEPFRNVTDEPILYGSTDNLLGSESGSNGNGSYVRFSDGTQMCWGVCPIGTTTDFAFPSAFSAAPSVNVTITGTSEAVIIARLFAVTPTWFSIRKLYHDGATFLPAGEPVHWTAIGRWK